MTNQNNAKLTMKTYKIHNPDTSSTRYSLIDSSPKFRRAWLAFIRHCKSDYKTPTSWWGRYKDLPVDVLRNQLSKYNATLGKWDRESGFLTLTFDDEGFTAFVLNWCGQHD